MSKLDEKIQIAKERLQSIEHEECLEELGKSLNLSHLKKIESTGEGDSSSEETKPSTIEDLELSPPAFSSLVQSPLLSP